MKGIAEMENKPKVSVWCMSYNHEKYISGCLDSIISQQTDFPFEIIINDDASTDSSPHIIENYKNRYPELIDAVLQQDNQYSIGGFSSLLKIFLERSHGELIAICECDDRWTDEGKLQKQVDTINETGAAVCAHRTETTAKNGVRIDGKDIPRIDSAFLLDRDDMVKLAFEYWISSSMIFHISSLLCSREVFDDGLFEMMDIGKVGDTPIVLNGILKGKTAYIPETMSSYRTFSDGSWTAGIVQDTEKRRIFTENICGMLEAFKEVSGHRYDDTVDVKISDFRFNLLMQQRRYKEIFNREYNEVLKRKTFKHRLKLLMYRYAPVIAESYDKLIGKQIYGW